MVRRYIFVRLKAEYAGGLKLVQLQKTAAQALTASYGVQGLHVGTAIEDGTEKRWSACLTVEYVSGVDLERSTKDPVMLAFVNNYLTPRAEEVMMCSFDGSWSGPRRR